MNLSVSGLPVQSSGSSLDPRIACCPVSQNTRCLSGGFRRRNQRDQVRVGSVLYEHRGQFVQEGSLLALPCHRREAEVRQFLKVEHEAVRGIGVHQAAGRLRAVRREWLLPIPPEGARGGWPEGGDFPSRCRRSLSPPSPSRYPCRLSLSPRPVPYGVPGIQGEGHGEGKSQYCPNVPYAVLRVHFLKTYLEPCLTAGLVERTIPDKPRSPKQRYRTTPAGRAVLGQTQKEK